jgi:hypothetical protein
MSSMSTGSRPISRFEALRHHHRWSNEDRATAEAEIDRLGVTEFRLQNSEGSVSLIRDGKAIAWFGAGRIAYLNRTVAHPDAFVVTGRESRPDIRHLPLSRFVANSGRTTAKEAAVSICPTCSLALPSTGVCDNCGAP